MPSLCLFVGAAARREHPALINQRIFGHRWGHTLLCLRPQVEQEGQYRSCCAVVTGLQRAVFFVPRPGVFAGEELARLEAAAAAAASDTGARGELLRHLHVRTPSKAPCRGTCWVTGQGWCDRPWGPSERVAFLVGGGDGSCWQNAYDARRAAAHLQVQMTSKS